MVTPGTCILPSSGNFILIITFPCFSDVYSLCIIVPFTVISVCDLKDKVQRVTVIQEDFVEKLNFLESKISTYRFELRNMARIIYELKDRLEAEKRNNSFIPQLDEISVN
ncbi:hypothetical protein SEVIR_5G264601v4 [Setaria viridis]